MSPAPSSTIVFTRHNGNQFTTNYECPWCGARQTCMGNFATEYPGREGWLSVICATPDCKRPAFIMIPLKPGQQVGNLSQSGPEMDLLIQPPPSPLYQEDGVTPNIARDFQEALRSEAAGFLFGAALVGRRVLQAAIREHGARGKTLFEEINSLSTEVLNKPLKDGAHEVRLVGNEAAHAEEVSATDVGALLDFTRDVLHTLYVVPARVAARRAQSAAKS